VFAFRVVASGGLHAGALAIRFYPFFQSWRLCGELFMVTLGSPLLSHASQRCGLVALMSVALTVASGCTSSTDRVEVSGKVTFKSGEAVNRGSIEFASEANGMRAGARIADSLYFIPRDKGLKPGKYLVRIYAPSSLLSGNGGPGGAGKLPEETVSAKYNVKSQLTVEVGSARKQEFDFQVEKASP
jgi:hypothetical protein